MTTKNTGGPAFPRLKNVISERRASDGKPVDRCEGADGMTLRDYFAAQALAGHGAWIPPMKTGEGHIEAKARFAYDLADAMLAEREK